MTGAVLVLTLLGCQPTGCGLSESTRARMDAAEHYNQGRAALAAGDADGAVAAFAAAAALNPASPVLVAWQARALELAGDDAAALALLDKALGRFPNDPELRFNRAALRARAGQLDAAAANLHVLLAAGHLQPEQAGADPDLAALRTRPELAALAPPQTVSIDVLGEAGSVLLGDSWDARVVVDAPVGSLSTIREMGEAPGLLNRERVVEDLLEARPGRSRRSLELAWRAVQPGTGSLGPWLVAIAGTSGLSEPMSVEVVEIGNRQGPLGTPGDELLVFPSAVVGDRQPPWVGALDGRLAVLTSAGSRAEVQGSEGELLEDETWELRERSQTRWVAHLYPLPASAQVVIRRGREVVLEQSWTADGSP